MKKVITLIILLLPFALIWAQNDCNECNTWYEDPPCSGNWVFQGSGNRQALARLWKSGSIGGACNRRFYSFNFRNSASMAQWIEWSISGTEWKWKVRKVGPNLCQTDGYYAGDCITLWVKSNYDVDITFSGFNKLYNPNSVDQYIEVWYDWGEFNVPPPKTNAVWIPADSLNNYVCHLTDSQDLHSGISFKFWNMIHVTNCNSACEYSDPNGATVTLALKCIKPWINPNTGYYQ